MRREVLLLIFLSILVSCAKTGMDGSVEIPVRPDKDNAEIDATCSVAQINSCHAQDRLSSGSMTRSVIGQTTAIALDANFLKLDQIEDCDIPADYKWEALEKWDMPQQRLLQAEILSSPDNTEGIHMRSIYFSRKQIYRTTDATPDIKDDDVVVGYVTRMVGWYPKTETLQLGDDGLPADAVFDSTKDSFVKGEDGRVCVKFTGLDGKTDVMMSDMREGRYDVRNSGQGEHSLHFRNNADDHDVQPFGHQFVNQFNDRDGYEYLNYFTFNHYLTAVRLYVQAKGSDLSLISWDQITDVVFLNQPTEVVIALPVEQARGTENHVNPDGTVQNPIIEGTVPTLPIENVSPIFGEVQKWSAERNLPIIREPMADNDPDHPEFSEVPTYPVVMKHDVSLDKEYLGYMLVRPDEPVELEVHTDAGIFSATIPTRAGYVEDILDAAGSPTGDTTIVREDILKAGNIYDIVIDIRADGSLDVVIGNEDDKHFRNLAPYNPEIASMFEYSNCYVVTPEMMKDDNGQAYEGYYFQAMAPGRGDLGIISSSTSELYPEDVYFEPNSARILWQDEEYLITHVELLHGYVRFMLNDECANGDKTGNAVIAVYDKSGNIIWSWHIWVPGNGLKDIQYELPQFSSFSVMNMNLGATRNLASEPANETGNDALNEAILNAYGLYYQWGRKDPSPAPPKYLEPESDLRTRPYYYMDEGTRTSVLEYNSADMIVEHSVRYPLDIMNFTGTAPENYKNDWLYRQVNQLWGYSVAAGKVDRKTIYDPCPYGYRVPDDELSELFEYCYRQNMYEKPANGYGIYITDDSSITSDGKNFFPYAGWRGRDVGMTDKTHSWFYVGTLGDYQDARIDATTGHRGRTLLVKERVSIMDGGTYQNAVYYDGDGGLGNRTSLASVRCIKYSDEPSVQNRW